MTSKPYPLYARDDFQSESLLRRALRLLPPIEAFGCGSLLVDGGLRVGLVSLEPQEKHAFACEASLLEGDLSGTSPPVEYSMEPEAFEASASLQSGICRPGLLVYSNYPPEAFESGASLVSGELT